MRSGAIQASRGAGTATRLGVSDDGILRELEEVGYAPDTVVLLDLALPIEVGMADGSVSQTRRELVTAAACGRELLDEAVLDQRRTWLVSATAESLPRGPTGRSCVGVVMRHGSVCSLRQHLSDVSKGPSLGRRHCAAPPPDAARHGSHASTPVEQTLPEIVLCIQRQVEQRDGQRP